jgi:single-stranded-DNA-specific exonuclease
MAGGLTVRLENIAELSERLNRLADEWLTEDDFIPISVADSLVSVADIQLGTIEQMQSLAPFGEGNPPPRFIVKGCKVRSVAAMGQGKQHVKLLLSSAGDRLSATVEAVGFHMGALAELIAPDAECDIFGEMSANEWNGTKKPQILIHDVRVSRPQVFDWRHESGIAAKLAGWAETFKRYGSQTFLPGVIISSECLPAAARLQLDSFPLWALNSLGETRPANRQAEGLQLEKMTDVVFYSLPPSAASLESLLARLHSAERLFAVFQPLPPSPAEAMPSREAFKKVYVCLRDMGMLPKDGAAFQALGRKAGLPAESARWIVEVFAELKFVLKTEDGYEYVAAPERQNLQSSRMYRERLERMNAMELFVRSPSAELAEWLLARLRPVFNHENALEEWV